MTITEQISYLSRWEFWLLTVLGLAVASAALYFAFRYLSLARTIEDTPTAKIRFAQQGYVELNGSARPIGNAPIEAPLTGTACCWYRYRIEKRGNKKWYVVERKESDAPFVVWDETGECRVSPAGAEITTEHKIVWTGRSKWPHARLHEEPQEPRSLSLRLAGLLNRELLIGSRYRYIEERILPGDLLYLIGCFRTRDEIDHQRERRENLGGLLREWKRNQASLLARFDANRDGRLDQAEWQQARQAAAGQLEREHRQQQAGGNLHSLSSRGSGNRPYLISTRPQFSLVKRYRVKAGIAITLFFLAGGVSFWMLGNHPGW